MSQFKNHFKTYFYIKGLHCASCVYTTEQALKRIKGVRKAVVNLADGRAFLISDQEINKEKIKKAINQVGYQVIFKDEELLGQNIEKDKEKELKSLKTKVVIGLIFSLFLVWGTFPKLMDYSPSVFKNYLFQLILATITQFYIGLRFYSSGLSFLNKGRINMDTLVVLGTTAAYVYSFLAIIFPSLTIEPYFDVSVVIISFVLLGRYLEERSKKQSGDAIRKLMAIRPKEATILIKNSKFKFQISK